MCAQIYEPFASDFGPLNLGNTFRFCQRLSALFQVLPLAEGSKMHDLSVPSSPPCEGSHAASFSVSVFYAWLSRQAAAVGLYKTTMCVFDLCRQQGPVGSLCAIAAGLLPQSGPTQPYW